MTEATEATGSALYDPRVFRRLRSTEFPWTAETTYLNNASIGPLPERTRRAVDTFTARRTAPHQFSDADLQGILQSARRTVARLLNASEHEIALATNTSYGINLAAGGLPLGQGDIVLVSDREFPANVYPWMLLRERGIDTELVGTDDNGWPDEERLLARLDDPRVRVLAISLVQFASGYKADLTRISAACQASDTFLVVDAIQGLGQTPVDVSETRIDVLASGAQKWLLSPWGAGFVYVRNEIIDLLRPPFAGWNAFAGTDDYSRLTSYSAVFKPSAARYEVGTLPFQELAAMVESIGLLTDLGIANVEAYLQEIAEPLYQAADRGEFEIVSPRHASHRSGIICVRPPHAVESFVALNRAGVVSAYREGAIRLSPHCYNTVEEIERVVSVLQSV